MKVLMPLLYCTVIGACSTLTVASAKTPDCSGIAGWPTSMAFSQMKNAGITDNDQLDFTKTRTVRLTSEKIGKDLYRQVYLVTFMRKDGHALEAITVSDASNEECSMSNVRVFVVSRQLDGRVETPKNSN